MTLYEDVEGLALHALSISESIGTSPLRRTGIVWCCTYGEAVRMMKVHRRDRRTLSFTYLNSSYKFIKNLIKIIKNLKMLVIKVLEGKFRFLWDVFEGI